MRKRNQVEAQKTTEEVRPLPLEFKEGGFQYTQQGRSTNWAIYKQERVGNRRVVGYEVVCIQRFGETRFPDGSVSPSREAYPRPEDWGVNGWTHWAYHEARQVLQARTLETYQER